MMHDAQRRATFDTVTRQPRPTLSLPRAKASSLADNATLGT